MNRLVIASSISAAAIVLASVPAAYGLVGNPSFSRHVPVVVPSGAQQVSFDSAGNPSTSSPSSSADDKGGISRHSEPGDDKGGASRNAGNPSTSTRSSSSDDKGGQTRHAEPGDDKGGDRARSATSTASSSATHSITVPTPKVSTSARPTGGSGKTSDDRGGPSAHAESGDDNRGSSRGK